MPAPLPLLSLAEIAHREESRLAVGISEVAPESIPFAGGRATRDTPGLFTNTANGVGHNGPVSEDEVSRMVEWYRSAGIEPRVEVSPYVHPTLLEHLGAAGFMIRMFENVFVCELDRGPTPAPPYAVPADVTISMVDPADDAMVRGFSQVVTAGFAGDVDRVDEASLDVMARVTRHPRTTSIVALRNGEIVGGGSLELCGDHGALFGLAVRREHRRIGIQQAMLAWRLRFAAERGVRFLTISARPNVATERNARRMGFTLAYTKAIMVRPGAGLAPVIE